MVPPLIPQVNLGVSLGLRSAQVVFGIVVLALGASTYYTPLGRLLSSPYAIGISVLTLCESVLVLAMFMYMFPIFVLVMDILLTIFWIISFGICCRDYVGFSGYTYNYVTDVWGDVYTSGAILWPKWGQAKGVWAISFLLFLIHLLMVILEVIYTIIPLKKENDKLLSKTRTLTIGSIFPREFSKMGPHAIAVTQDPENVEIINDKEGTQEETVVVAKPEPIVEEQVVIGNDQVPPTV